MIDVEDEVERSLLEAIFENPADDASRLVYADWLLERARPHGELIRLQCEATQRRLLNREQGRLKQLLALEKQWLGPLSHLTAKGLRIYDRGFLSACALAYRVSMPSVTSSLHHPAWGLVTSIDLAAALPVDELEKLVEQPVLRWLRTLRGLRMHTLKAMLTSWSTIPLKLEGIGLTHSIDRSLEAALIRVPKVLPNLKHLELRYTDRELMWLLDTPLGTTLTSLSTQITDDAEDWLRAVANHRTLTQIDLVIEPHIGGTTLRFARGWTDLTILGPAEGAIDTLKTIDRSSITSITVSSNTDERTRHQLRSRFGVKALSSLP